jgi:hypothetical protein
MLDKCLIRLVVEYAYWTLKCRLQTYDELVGIVDEKAYIFGGWTVWKPQFQEYTAPSKLSHITVIAIAICLTYFKITGSKSPTFQGPSAVGLTSQDT